MLDKTVSCQNMVWTTIVHFCEYDFITMTMEAQMGHDKDLCELTGKNEENFNRRTIWDAKIQSQKKHDKSFWEDWSEQVEHMQVPLRRNRVSGRVSVHYRYATPRCPVSNFGKNVKFDNKVMRWYLIDRRCRCIRSYSKMSFKIRGIRPHIV